MKYHLVKYTYNCSPMLKKFKTLKAMNSFIAKYKKKYSDAEDGFWVDFSITDISGEIKILDGFNIPVEEA